MQQYQDSVDRLTGEIQRIKFSAAKVEGAKEPLKEQNAPMKQEVKELGDAMEVANRRVEELEKLARLLEK